MIINRVWEMPNKNTFKITNIRKLIYKYLSKGKVIDPFANNMNIRELIETKAEYVSNDLDNIYECDFNMEAQDFMKLFDNKTVDMVLYDPPYSGRQVKEVYNKLNKTVNREDTNGKYWTKFKKEISRIVKDNGIVISFGWNSNGIGMKYGFEIIEILVIAHGGGHYDTICTVERKRNSLF